MQEIDKFVLKCINEKCILTNNDIESIVNLFMKKYDLQKYIDDVRFQELESEGCSGMYDANSKELIFDTVKLEIWINQNYDILLEDYPNLEYHHFYSFIQLLDLYHELRHAIQNKFRITLGKTKSDLLISEIVYDCYMATNSQYAENYRLFPMEKDAVVFSYGNCARYFGQSQSVNNDFICFFINQYFNKLKEGYRSDFSGNGLKEFYEKVFNKVDSYISCYQKKDCLSLARKVGFNFPLTDSEREYLQNFEVDAKTKRNKKKLLVKKSLVD